MRNQFSKLTPNYYKHDFFNFCEICFVYYARFIFPIFDFWTFWWISNRIKRKNKICCQQTSLMCKYISVKNIHCLQSKHDAQLFYIVIWKFYVITVEFVQLSKTVQIPERESMLLRCVANKPVVECEWSWKPGKSSDETTVIKKFPPNKETDHDCSARFKNVLQKDEGLWTCGVRLTAKGQLHEAPPVTVTLLPSSKYAHCVDP